MADKGKVIKGLEQHLARTTTMEYDEVIDSCRECPYLETRGCPTHLVRDALELLKEGENDDT